MDARAVEELHDLERRDDELAAAAERLRALEAGIATIRERAEAIDAFFAGYAEHESARRAEVAEAESELAERREEQARAEADLDKARDDEERELRAKAVARARDHVAVALSRLDRAHADLEQLEREAAQLPSELTALEAQALELAASELPAPGPEGLVAWASHAHAELFVALSQLDTRRDRIIREANELASSLLGEPTFGSTVAQARRQVEART